MNTKDANEFVCAQPSQRPARKSFRSARTCAEILLYLKMPAKLKVAVASFEIAEHAGSRFALDTAQAKSRCGWEIDAGETERDFLNFINVSRVLFPAETRKIGKRGFA